MSELSPDNFSALYWPFTGHRVAGATTLWCAAEEDGPVPTNDPAERKRAFAARYAYMVAGGATFDRLDFVTSDSMTLQAERYGGTGIGDNGGGARCGNLGKFQVKGVGQTPLVGKGRDVHHSYGGFKAVYAIHEAIYSCVLERIMPVGVARVTGVILTGPDAAYVSGMRRGWGALMVREIALRPGSFIRASHFKPAAPYRRTMLSDVGRVRAANRRLYRDVSGVDGFIGHMRRFLERCADQMSFARMARIMHGAITPSNLCFDGRWIDLTNTSFLSSAENNGGGNRSTPSFYEESAAVLGVAATLVQSFEKFNGVRVAIEPLQRHYKSSVQEGQKRHLGYLLGFALPLANAAFAPDIAQLHALVMRTLSAAPVRYDRWPTDYPADDPILLLIESLYRAAVQPPARPPQAPLAALVRCLREARRSAPFQHGGERQFVAAAYIVAAKRCLLAAYFYKGRLDLVVSAMLEQQAIAELEAMLESTLAMADWAFSGVEDGIVTLLRIPALELGYSPAAGHFVARDGHGASRRFDSARATLGYLAEVDQERLLRHGFDFHGYLVRLLRTLADIAGEGAP